MFGILATGMAPAIIRTAYARSLYDSLIPPAEEINLPKGLILFLGQDENRHVYCSSEVWITEATRHIGQPVEGVHGRIKREILVRNEAFSIPASCQADVALTQGIIAFGNPVMRPVILTKGNEVLCPLYW